MIVVLTSGVPSVINYSNFIVVNLPLSRVTNLVTCSTGSYTVYVSMTIVMKDC